MKNKLLHEILIIDDDAQSMFIAQQILKTAQFKIHQASSVKLALELVEKRAPHLILLDLVLKKETGFDFLKKYHELGKSFKAPVIVMTGFNHQDVLSRSISLGAKDIILKPIDATVLLQKISKALNTVEHLRVKLPRSHLTEVSIKTTAHISHANEVGFLIEAPLRIAEGASLKISAPFLKDMSCENCLFKRTQRAPHLQTKTGKFLNEIILVGLSAVTLQKIRDQGKKWKNKK